MGRIQRPLRAPLAWPCGAVVYDVHDPAHLGIVVATIDSVHVVLRFANGWRSEVVT